MVLCAIFQLVPMSFQVQSPLHSYLASLTPYVLGVRNFLITHLQLLLTSRSAAESSSRSKRPYISLASFKQRVSLSHEGTLLSPYKASVFTSLRVFAISNRNVTWTLIVAGLASVVPASVLVSLPTQVLIADHRITRLCHVVRYRCCKVQACE